MLLMIDRCCRTFLDTIDANILPITYVRLIGWQLLITLLSLLKIRITFACLHKLGTSPEVIDLLNIFDSATLIV